MTPAAVRLAAVKALAEVLMERNPGLDVTPRRPGGRRSGARLLPAVSPGELEPVRRRRIERTTGPGRVNRDPVDQ